MSLFIDDEASFDHNRWIWISKNSSFVRVRNIQDPHPAGAVPFRIHYTLVFQTIDHRDDRTELQAICPIMLSADDTVEALVYLVSLKDQEYAIVWIISTVSPESYPACRLSEDQLLLFLTRNPRRHNMFQNMTVLSVHCRIIAKNGMEISVHCIVCRLMDNDKAYVEASKGGSGSKYLQFCIRDRLLFSKEHWISFFESAKIDECELSSNLQLCYESCAALANATIGELYETDCSFEDHGVALGSGLQQVGRGPQILSFSSSSPNLKPFGTT